MSIGQPTIVTHIKVNFERTKITSSDSYYRLPLTDTDEPPTAEAESFMYCVDILGKIFKHTYHVIIAYSINTPFWHLASFPTTETVSVSRISALPNEPRSTAMVASSSMRLFSDLFVQPQIC